MMVDMHTWSRKIGVCLGEFTLGWAIAATATLAQDPKMPEFVQRIDMVHMSHTDVGFTDHPLACRRQQMRYLDIAIDAVLATKDNAPEERFCWTAEAALTVDDWWQAANASRR